MIKKNLVPLALGGFGIGMTEFVMMGILPDVAHDLSISISQAGYLVSAYALGVVVGAPTLVGGLARYASNKVLMLFMLLFTVFNGLSALSPSFELLLACRFLAGLPHGAFFGVGAVVAARIAEEGKAAAAMATMFAGLTLANVVGVPFGTFVGHHVSWRLAFVIVALIGTLTLWSLKRYLPYIEGNRQANLLDDLRIFRKPALWLALAITSIGTGGFFAWFSYIAPLLTEVSGFPANAVPLVLNVTGIGMTVGVIFGGRLADRVPAEKAVLILLTTMVMLLLLNVVLAHSQAAMLVCAFAIGANALALGPPIQMLLIRQAQEAEMLGSSLGQSGFNIGNALGAFLGGIPLSLGRAYTTPSEVAAALALGGVLLTLMLFAYQSRTRLGTSAAT